VDPASRDVDRLRSAASALREHRDAMHEPRHPWGVSVHDVQEAISALGGAQLHDGRNGEPQDFEYVIEAPAAGRYRLTARVVTPSWKQSLMVTANDAAQPVPMPLPFTVGMWETAEPVEIELVQGRNVLRFSRPDATAGVTIKEFRLTPAAGGSPGRP
jgi:hypothetical protein